MKRQIKKILSILFAVLFVTTLTASAVSASSASTMQVSSYIPHDGYCGNGLSILYYIIHHIPIPDPDPEPWLIYEKGILSNEQVSIKSY